MCKISAAAWKPRFGLNFPGNYQFRRAFGGTSSRVHTKDGIGGGYFGGEVQMGVDVGGGGNVAVTQPLPDLLQAHPVGVQKTGATVPAVRLRSCIQKH